MNMQKPSLDEVERLNDLVWDMRESYDEAGSKLVYEVIQAARGELPSERTGDCRRNSHAVCSPSD